MSDTEATRSTGETLRALAEWIDAHPAAKADAITLYQTPVQVSQFWLEDAPGLPGLLGALGGRWDKEMRDTSDQVHFAQEILPGVIYRITVDRSTVCERVKTGETVVHEPDPDAVAALPTVERVVETFEWRCEPILSKAAA